MLLSIPATLLALAALLAFSAYAEERMVSSRALIVRVASSRSSRPEVAEALVAREVERLIQRSGR